VTRAAGSGTAAGSAAAPRLAALDASLRADGIAKSFGGVQALAGCTLTVPAGRITGLIGPNGSGKTTLFNVMTGYERPDAGQVYLGDRQITGASPQRVFALGVGRTFQLTRIFPRLTVLENMLVPAQRGRSGRRHREHAMDLLAFTGIASHAHNLAGTLSYGQRKLLELAYVLVADPAVVLLDEPAGGVNPTLIHHIADRIRDMNKAGTTFLLVEHNMDFVMTLCDQVTVLDSGAVVATGTPEVVRTDPRVLDAYLGTGDDDDE
jgi:ABC-type branched-subunit amino acid transport system ATPase component